MPGATKSTSQINAAPRRVEQKKQLRSRGAAKAAVQVHADSWETAPVHGALKLVRKALKSFGRPSMHDAMSNPKPARKTARQLTATAGKRQARAQVFTTTTIETRKVGLMNFPQPTAQETLEIDALGLITRALDGEAILQPPGLPISVAINSDCDPKMAYQLATGKYELDETTLIQRHVRLGDKVLDIGACVGVTSALCGAITKKRVVAVEPNPFLHKTIRTQASINNSSVKVEQYCVGLDHGSNVSFHVHRQPWRSALQRYTDVEQDYSLVKCKMQSLRQLVNRHRPDVVLLDVEGAERNLFLEPLQHKPKLLIVEIHNFYIGETACCEVVQQIIDQNYRLVDRMGWNWVFRLSDDCT